MPKKPKHGGPRKPGPGKKIGRPRTSPGWASITVRLPLPIVEAYRALSEEERAAVQARMRAAVEAAVKMR